MNELASDLLAATSPVEQLDPAAARDRADSRLDDFTTQDSTAEAGRYAEEWDSFELNLAWETDIAAGVMNRHNIGSLIRSSLARRVLEKREITRELTQRSARRNEETRRRMSPGSAAHRTGGPHE